MAGQNTAVFSNYKNQTSPQATVDEPRSAGIPSEEVPGVLPDMGMPEYEAKRYEDHVKIGGILLSVHCDTSDEVSCAKDILKHTGASDISSTGEASADTKADRSDRPVRRATN